MNKLPLKIKMTLLYSTLTLLLAGLLLYVLYFTMQHELMRGQEALLALSYEQVTALIEMEDGQIIADEEELRLTPGAAYQIVDQNGIALVIYEMPVTLSQIPFDLEEVREVDIRGEHWLLKDGISSQDDMLLHIRIGLSLASVYDTLGLVRRITLIALPLLLLISAGLGMLIAGRSLRPIERIIRATQSVAKGDLSQRIDLPPSHDEVGQLAQMMNDMLEKLEVSFQREKRFASDASHELRTPVSVIWTHAEALLKELPQGSDAARTAETILAESERMRRIIQQLLILTRGEEGKYVLEFAPVDLAEVAQAVAAQLLPAAQEKDVRIRVSIQKRPWTQGDQSLLTQMMLNLVDNAVKYSGPGGQIEIALCEVGGRCCLRVSDQGIGMSKENLGHIFERFYRADTARDRSGTGLGLSIVHWIVEAHHGSIEVTSKLQQGTTVTVLL